MSEEQFVVAEPDPFDVDPKHKTGPRYKEPLFYRETPNIPQAPGLSNGKPVVGVYCGECCRREDPDYCPYRIKRQMEADSKKRVFVPDKERRKDLGSPDNFLEEDVASDVGKIDAFDYEVN